MKTIARILTILAIFIWISSAVAPVQSAPGAKAGDPERRELIPSDWVTYTHPETGLLRFLSLPPGEAIQHSATLAQDASPEAGARDFLWRYGELFGVQNPERELTVMKTSSLPGDAGGVQPRSFVRFQQVYQGIPVLGGELIVQLDDQEGVTSASGEILPVSDLNTTPQVEAGRATQIALETVARDYEVDAAGLAASPPELWIYNPLVLGAPGPRFTRLVWRSEVTPLELAPIRELVLVDANLGNVALSFNQVETSRNRLTYDANNLTSLPGMLVCNEANPGCSGGDSHEVAAHVYAGATYDFYMARHLRDSFDNAGETLISTVHYKSGYDNAFWNGTQMVYGDAYGFPLADDVVAHEITHGVTDRESLLFYFYQSGAISESFSDIWGELIDLYQATSNDAGDTRWDMGEDVSGLGTMRNMMYPADYGDPDKMSSPNYYCNQSNLYEPVGDNGGVHINSGVGNKAAALMVDGGTFNTYTVSALGYVKVAKIYYEAQTNLLTSAADYQNLYAALLQACSNLGYSAGDCQEVKDALDAVEMNTQPGGCPAAHAPVCDSGTPNNLFFDDIESGDGHWTEGSLSGTLYWYVPQTSSPPNLLPGPYATSGTGNIWGFAQGSPLGGTSDTYLAMNSNVTLPAKAFMHFNHSFGFQSSYPSPTTRYDGGILEYSTNSGTSWTNAGALITHNGYNGTLESSNPLGAIQAFTADSRGYISSRLNLSSLAGQSVRFRFRIGTDATSYDYGWFIDDVRIYTCITGLPSKVFLPLTRRYQQQTPPAAPTNLVASATSSSAIHLTWDDNASNEDGFYLERSPDGSTWAPLVTLLANSKSHDDTGLQSSTLYYYRVRAFNGGGTSAYSNTASATTLPSTPSLCNGNFEQGSACWTQFSTHGWQLIVNSGFPGTVTPHSGSWAAWLGGEYDEISYIEQQVSVPAGSYYLAYYHWIASDDFCGNDFGGVVVNGTVVDDYDLCNSQNTNGWVKHVVNLSAYAGQLVTLQIWVETDESLHSNLFVDDVAFQASPAAVENSIPLSTMPQQVDLHQALPRSEVYKRR